MLENIKSSALETGACKKINRVKGFPSLIKLMFSPQGIEFCEKYNFPSLEVFREDKEQVKDLNILVDAGDIEPSSRKYICLVGDTQATIHVSGVEHTHTIILMHGAKATINASNYAVVKVVNISGEYSINKDNTAIAL